MLRADDPETLRRLWQAYCGEGDVSVLQQYIEGPDDQHYAYYAYRARDGVERAVLTVRKQRLYPTHAGDGVFAHVVDYPVLEQIGREVLHKLGYLGIASVCFKIDPDLGPLIYEINGRLPAMHGSFALVGVDLPYLMYADATGIAYSSPPPNPTTARRGSSCRMISSPAATTGAQASRSPAVDWLLQQNRCRRGGGPRRPVAAISPPRPDRQADADVTTGATKPSRGGPKPPRPA